MKRIKLSFSFGNVNAKHEQVNVKLAGNLVESKPDPFDIPPFTQILQLRESVSEPEFHLCILQIQLIASFP